MEGLRCAISVDLDSIDCYYRIHGLGTAPSSLRHVILHKCLPRFLQELDSRGLRATFFVVARDIDPDGGDADAVAISESIFRDCVAAGHELGNHSYSHPYDLARWSARDIAGEIRRAGEVIGALGGEVVGFRAPGYDLSSAMARELDRAGYLYDSSVFPAPAYYAAKLAVLAAMRATGRRTGAVVTDARNLVAPVLPYRLSLRRPWRRGGSSLIELPITVTPWLRIPAIGTSLLLAPRPVRERLLDRVEKGWFFNFELHGIDLADADEDGLPAELVARQPDLRIPLAEKRARLGGVLDRLVARYQIEPLKEVAARVAERT